MKLKGEGRDGAIQLTLSDVLNGNRAIVQTLNNCGGALHCIRKELRDHFGGVPFDTVSGRRRDARIEFIFELLCDFAVDVLGLVVRGACSADNAKVRRKFNRLSCWSYFLVISFRHFKSPFLVNSDNMKRVADQGYPQVKTGLTACSYCGAFSVIRKTLRE